MQTQDLRALLAVVQHGSFQAAGDALGIPRSKLRRQVARLEKDVGSQLLFREARGVRLTVAGEQVAERAGSILAELAAMVSDANATDGAVLGTLRMIVPVGTPTSLRVRALLQLEALYPQIALHVVEVDDPLTLLRDPFDIMLHLGPPASREGWFSRVLMRLPIRLVAAPSYLARHGTPTTVQDLGTHRLLTWNARGQYADSWPLRSGGSVTVTPSVVSANLELLSQLAAAGGGIALLPGPDHLFHPSDSELEPVLPDLVGDELALRALSPHPSRTDPRLRALMRNVQQLMDSMVEPAPTR